MAAGGMRPYFAVYSTFLQRGYDQVVHDVCLQNLPVCLLIDRAGLVGDDGATHHGVFDLAYLRHIPRLQIFAPRDTHELDAMMDATLRIDGPCAIRYARDGCDMGEGHPCAGFTPGVWEPLGPLPAAVAILTFGRMVRVSLEAAALLAKRGLRATVINASTLKPLDAALLDKLSAQGASIVTVEEHALLGGFGEAVAGHCVARGQRPPIACLGIGDAFVTHGGIAKLLELCGLTAPEVARRVEEALAARAGQADSPAAGGR
jgi:1-deoxy-D-xylulose-5-phosphate synthase